MSRQRVWMAMHPWLRPVPFALLGAGALARLGTPPVDGTAARSVALCGELARDGVECAAGDVVWLDGPSGVVGAMHGRARAILRGKEAPTEPGASEAIDLYAVTARLSPEGQLLEASDLFNLTHSNGADEGTPVVSGTMIAFVVSVDGHPEAVQVLDLAGHDPKAYEDLAKFQRAQVEIADYQATGRLHGIKKTVFGLGRPPTTASVAFTPAGMLAINTDDTTILVDPRTGDVTGKAEVRVGTEVIAKPPTFAPWMSDRLRAVSWFGDEKNQVLKAVLFTALEWVKARKAALTGDTGEKDVADDLGEVASSGGQAAFTDPEIGWPPRPLDPMIKPTMAGEGQWISLDKDPFITPIPGIPHPFVTTYVRSDPTTLNTRVYITMWDPRLVALHMEAGTVEPVSATGEAGTGQIPRTPEVIRHVVAGFNGGFQATHGEFGMQADGVLYLPPKPYAATVMDMRDGATEFGAWPASGKKSVNVSDDILSFRQNMTPLVQGDKYNPWGRAWWGGVPPGWHDAVHTTRSGICITKENFVAYFWGNDIGPEPLGRAMLVARCAFGMHLDMNPGLAGFEFYDVQPVKTFVPLGRPLQNDWEKEEPLRDMPDFIFRSRRMVKSMGHILFPRYIKRDGRDFFYLTTRTVLPGLPIEPDAPWRTRGLPQHGFPYATATTTVHVGGRQARVVRIDPRTVRGELVASLSDEAPKDVVASFGHPPRTAKKRDAGVEHAPLADASLRLSPHGFVIDRGSGAAFAELVTHAVAGRAAAGVSDEDGMLQWVELLPDETADLATSEAMLGLLERLGCSTRGIVATDARLYLGTSLDAGGDPAPPAVMTGRLVRKPSPAAKLAFESTEVVPQSVWYPLQQQRVKWRPTLAPPDKPAASGSASASPPPSAVPPTP